MRAVWNNTHSHMHVAILLPRSVGGAAQRAVTNYARKKRKGFISIMQPLTFKAQRRLPHTQVGLILAGNSNKGTQRTLWLEECSVASPLMSPC